MLLNVDSVFHLISMNKVRSRDKFNKIYKHFESQCGVNFFENIL